MYNQNNNAQEEPTTIPMFPRLPNADDPRWRDVAVRSRSQNHASITRFPIENSEKQIAIVYAGDTIAIMPEVQHEYFVAVRIGYHVGWINFRHVKLVSLARGRRLLEETKPTPTVERSDPITRPRTYDERLYREPPQYHEDPEQRDVQEVNKVEQDTQPAPPVQFRSPPIERNDVKRIINKLKSLGGIFSRR